MFKKTLKFFQLSDRAGNLSLTNIALIIVLTKIAISPFDYSGAVLLLPVIASYMHKRHESNKVAKAELEAQAKVDSEQHELIKSQTEALKAIESKLNDQQKVIDEAKSVMTAQKLNAGLKRTQL